MDPELVYFLKINVAIILFYAFYRLLFNKDTFFHWRRTALLCFFMVSLLYPLLNVEGWVKAHEPMVAMANLYATMVLPESVNNASQPATIDWQEVAPQLLKFIYWAGVLLLLIRFLIQLGSIIRLHVQCKKSTLYGTRVHLLKKATSPFSFFNWIFIHPNAYIEAEIDEIVTHEKTHAHQYHSIDVLISELMCIFCWFNPFIWLMKREVRGNLEYMADHKVLETGHDSKSYQYHLLGLAHQKAAANLSNSFNVLPLKNRIKMMNKRRTKEIGRTKYLLFLPLASLLLIVSNIEIVARTTKVFATEIMESTKETDVATLQDKKTAQPAKSNTAPQQKDTDQDEPIFEVVENAPEFPGGVNGLLAYLRQNVRYPAEAHAIGIQGRVIVSFVVKKDGSIDQIKVVHSVDPYLDKEASRVISTMPKWKPGTQRGKPVNVRFSVPIVFHLSGPALPKAEEIKAPDLSEIIVVAKKSEEEPDTEAPIRLADKMPSFPGGTPALMQFLAKNIKYPTIAQKNKEQGKVILKMVVGKDGTLSDIQIAKSISPSLDAEAIRVMSNMPRWVPGTHQGKAVSVQYTIPVVFRLQ